MTQAQQVAALLDSNELLLGVLARGLRSRDISFTRAPTDDMLFYYFEDGSKLGTHYKKNQWWAVEPR